MSNQTKNRWMSGAGLAFGALVFGGLLAGCGGHSGPPYNPPPQQCTDPPAVRADWVIDKQATGAVLSCAQAAANTVELTLDNQTFDFNCDDGQGLTTQLAAGTYDASFTLLFVDQANNAQVLSQTPSMTINVASCGVTDLGTVQFDVN